MNIRKIFAAAGAVVVLITAICSTTASESASASASAGSASSAPVLTSIRAARHPGFDRLVFQFRGRVPAHRSATYVKHVRADGSGHLVRIKGKAKMLVRFYFANGHNDHGTSTFGPARRTFNLPGIIQVVNVGDFEAVLTFGVGVSRHAPFHMFKLTNPSRVVIDIKIR
jgi:hypothetical protein